jgi:hypothetical protein
MSLGNAKASNICSDNYQHNFSWNPIEASNKEEWLWENLNVQLVLISNMQLWKYHQITHVLSDVSIVWKSWCPSLATRCKLSIAQLFRLFMVKSIYSDSNFRFVMCVIFLKLATISAGNDVFVDKETLMLTLWISRLVRLVFLETFIEIVCTYNIFIGDEWSYVLINVSCDSKKKTLLQRCLTTSWSDRT